MPRGALDPLRDPLHLIIRQLRRAAAVDAVEAKSRHAAERASLSLARGS